ncbi:MAG: MmgE/PrpD family protein [Planctomycetota bacterium]|nr:MmgE/PrpD family protein [Planctomycetota bacterium]
MGLDASLINTRTHVHLPAESNQALGLAHYAIDFLSDDESNPGRGEPSESVLERTELFHTDAVICGASALALNTNAPTILRQEALQYATPPSGSGSLAGVPWAKGCVRSGVPVFGSSVDVAVEKAIVANCAAVREWDSNGTNFGFNPRLGHTAGEFGHNDFYSVATAAAQMRGRDGAFALLGMVLHDEIRGRLAEVFSLKSYKVDHVVHGAIASAVVFGAMMGATPEQIESAVGMVVAHAIPFRAIRAGKQLSDSKGASAAISTEFAILSVKRSMAGFLGPRDIFRNPEAIFRLFQGPGQLFFRQGDGGKTGPGAGDKKKDASPFDLVLGRAGDDFAVMGMHFKLGLYEHQSAGALQGLINLIARSRGLLEDQSGDCILKMVVRAYEPAFGIIGDPAKRNPTTRQSADHSMLYLVCTKLRKALELHAHAPKRQLGWKELMLGPYDFDKGSINDPLTRALMAKMSFEHGGAEYDAKYPDGIPTSIVITDEEGVEHDSGLVMYPGGHARNQNGPDKIDLRDVLNHKFNMLGKLAVAEPKELIARLSNLQDKTPRELAGLYQFEIRHVREKFE